MPTQLLAPALPHPIDNPQCFRSIQDLQGPRYPPQTPPEVATALEAPSIHTPEGAPRTAPIAPSSKRGYRSGVRCRNDGGDAMAWVGKAAAALSEETLIGDAHLMASQTLVFPRFPPYLPGLMDSTPARNPPATYMMASAGATPTNAKVSSWDFKTLSMPASA